MLRVVSLGTKLSILCILMLVLARMAGTVRSSPLLDMLDSPSCPQPCWHGIQPGVTTIPQASRIIRQDRRFRINTDGLYELCWTSVEDRAWGGCATHLSSADPAKPIERLVLWPPDTVRFGDAITLFGEPQALDLCWRTGDLVAHVYFNDEIDVMVYLYYTPAPSGGLVDRFEPDMPVREIWFRTSARISHAQPPQPWRGFTVPEKRWACTE